MSHVIEVFCKVQKVILQISSKHSILDCSSLVVENDNRNSISNNFERNDFVQVKLCLYLQFAVYVVE